MAKKSKGFAGAWIVRNIIGGVFFVAFVVAAASIFLSIRTRHGKEVSVPDLSGLSVPEARKAAAETGLRIQIADSVYMRRIPRGAVVSQLPRAESSVKPGRKISLTINSQVPKKVTMPNLIHVSLRQAMAELSSRGLILGNLKYVSDIATNNVLRQQVRGFDIEPGKEVYSGTTVDLVLGLNGSDAMTYVPKLNGYKYLSAIDALHDNSLNVTAIIFDKTVKTYADSVAATVYSQRPAATGYPTVMGTGVTLYLSLDAGKSSE